MVASSHYQTIWEKSGFLNPGLKNSKYVESKGGNGLYRFWV